MQKFIQLNDDKLKSFAQFFLGEYIEQRGFGSMNKNDIEILVYQLLRQTGYLNGKSINDNSLKLKVTKAKIKRLDYEAALRYGETNDEILMGRAIECLKKAQFSEDRKNIRFAVEDELLRNFISAKFYELNSFNDTSHNRDIISVDIEFFAQFLAVYIYPNVDEQEKENFFEEVKKVWTKDTEEKQKQFKEVNKEDKPSKLIKNLAYILEHVAEGTAKGVVTGAMGSTTSIFTNIGKLADFSKAIIDKITNKNN